MFSNDIYRSANNRIELNGKNQQVWPFIMIQRENYIDHFYQVTKYCSWRWKRIVNCKIEINMIENTRFNTNPVL